MNIIPGITSAISETLEMQPTISKNSTYFSRFVPVATNNRHPKNNMFYQKFICLHVPDAVSRNNELSDFDSTIFFSKNGHIVMDKLAMVVSPFFWVCFNIIGITGIYGNSFVYGQHLHNIYVITRSSGAV